MEVIGLCGDQHARPDVMVRLTHEEMLLVTTGNPFETMRFATGHKLNICERFHHAQLVLERTANAKRTSGQLRALADTLELAFPTLDAIAADPGSEVTA